MKLSSARLFSSFKACVRGWRSDMHTKERARARLRFQKLHEASVVNVQIEATELGLGAIWLQALYIQDAFHSLNVLGQIDVSSSPYSGTSAFDPLNAFWKPRKNIESFWSARFSSKELAQEIGLGRSYNSFDEVNQIWSRCYVWQEDVKESFEEALNSLCGTDPFVAVHYRGTDKATEAPRVAVESVLAEARKVYEHFGRGPILLFSDEEEFLMQARRELGDLALPVPTRLNGTRGPVHFEAGERGPEAAWDAAFAVYCFSLATCLVKTPSTLSGFAPILNPALPVVPVGHLRRDFAFFPDKLIHTEI